MAGFPSCFLKVCRYHHALQWDLPFSVQSDRYALPLVFSTSYSVAYALFFPPLQNQTPNQRKTPILRPALQSKQSSLCGLHRSGDRGGGGPNGQIVSVKRAADGRRQRSRKIINEEREKYRAKNESLRNTSTASKGTTFVILKDHRSAPIRKERLSPTSKARRKASRNKFVEKGGMPDRVKSFREIDSRQDRPRARPGLVKLIRNGPRKVQNLIKCRPSRAETGLAGRKNGIRLQKKEKTG